LNLPVNIFEILLGWLAVGIGSLLQGCIGFGIALVAAPFLALLDPEFIPGPMLINGLVCAILSVLREHRAIDFKGLPIAVTGRVLGTIVALCVIASLSGHWFPVLVGGLIVVTVLICASGAHLPFTPLSLLISGTLSGFMATTISIGGPPLALAFQDQSGARLRANLAGLFIFGVSISLLGLALVGKFGIHEILMGVILLPGTIIGFLFSNRWICHFDRHGLRKAVLLVSGSAGIVLIIKSLIQIYK
jgi:uncharacterized membrane protein YfcA